MDSTPPTTAVPAGGNADRLSQYLGVWRQPLKPHAE